MTSEQGATRVEVEVEIAATLKRGGLTLGADQIRNLAEGYQFVRTELEALRDRLPPVTEPVLTFDSAEASRAPQPGEDHAS